MQGNPTLLLIRPHRDSVRTAEQFRGSVKVIISPVLRIVPVKTTVDLAKFDHFVFTSKNGVRSLSNLIDLAGKSAFAVGLKTGEMAEGLGMRVQMANRDVDGLFSIIKRQKPAGKLLHVHGCHTVGNLATKLKTAGLDTDNVILYEQFEQPLSAQTCALLEGEGDIVLPLYSPRSARLFSDQALQLNARAKLHLVAISEKTLAQYNGPTPKSAIVAKTTDAAGMNREITNLIVTTS